MMGGPRRRGAPMPRMSIKGQGHILKRLMKIVFENYLWQFIAVIVCIVVTAYATIQSSTFTRDLVDVYIAGIQKGTKTMGDLANAMIPLGCVLALGVAASYIRQRLMVSVGQGTMLKIRTDLFTHMESLPIRYFDTHSHGDIMSIYTNDVDTLRQLISQSIPEIINGERKSESMDRETRETAAAMAEYSRNEVRTGKQKILGILLSVFGLFIIVSALMIFPSDSSWGGIYATLGSLLLVAGIYFLIRPMVTKRSLRIGIVLGCMVLLLGAFSLFDYVAVSQFGQVPRFRYETQYDSRAGDRLVHKTLFFTAVQEYPGTEQERVYIVR